MGKVSVLFILSCIVFFGPLSLQAENMRFSFKDIPESLNIHKSQHPAARIIRSSITRSLFRMKESKGYKYPSLDLVSKVEVLEDSSTVIFKLKDNASFSNGVVLSKDDVVFSLQLCQKYGSIGEITEIGIEKRRVANTVEPWIKVNSGKGTSSEKLFALFANCPIYEKKSAELFEESFGYGTNIVSVGPFVIDKFILGRSFTLLRSPFYPESPERPQEMVLMEIMDSSRAISALQGGDVDVVSIENGETEAQRKVREDETLVLSECDGDLFAYRKSLSLNCNEYVQTDNLHYRH